MMTSIEREKIRNVGTGMIASGRPFKGLTNSLEEWPQQCSLKVGLPVYVYREQFKENKTLKCNLSEGEESWRNDDKILFWIWQASQLFDGKKILAEPKAMSSRCLFVLTEESEPGSHILLWSRNSPRTQILWPPQNEPTVRLHDTMTHMGRPWSKRTLHRGLQISLA